MTQFNRCFIVAVTGWGSASAVEEDGEMGRWGDTEMGRWGDGEIAREFKSGIYFFFSTNVACFLHQGMITWAKSN
ncbi:hypothetical protein [Calothrix sp. UHCC 0171]|uniref:hypothetical protein n=1 Tax=Calothrix sp. UHCC 0171 TaxID=3110245 RepID=UPI002B1F6D4C|nr:hypothetical protein [Calothrix sp. UHCC 0171]MEA5571347.1 hypothetical protein [Calothrix sp. UHCC 0171]